MTRGKRSDRKRSVGITDAVSLSACWNSGTPLAKGGTTFRSAVWTSRHRPPTFHTPAASAGNMTRCPQPHRRAPTGARSASRWPRAPGPNHPQARSGAQKRRHCTGTSRTYKPPCTATRVPRLQTSCGSTCTCGTPRPLRTCRTCSHPDPRPTPRLAEPTAPCPAEGGTCQSTPEPAAKRRRGPSGAWWLMR